MTIKNKKGAALITAYFVIFALTIFSTAFLSRSISEKTTSERYAKSKQAFWVAEGGIHQALWELNSNNCNNCQTCGSNKCLAGTITGFGDYDVTIDLTNSTLSSIGSVPARTSDKLIAKTVQTNLSGGANSIFTHAAYANNDVTINKNAYIDSFDSSIGPYSYYFGGNIGSNGNIGTSGTSTNIINIKKNAFIMGNAETGPGGTIKLGNNAVITGTTTNTSTRTLDPVVVPSSLTGLSSGGSITVNNNNFWTVGSGDYKYDSITLKKNVAMTVTGDATIYVLGDFTTGNNVDITITPGSSLTYYGDGIFSVNQNAALNTMEKDPNDFIIYSTYSGANGILLKGNSEFYGAIYAPDTDVKFNQNAAIYGALVGDTVTIGKNANIHYDESLNTILGGSSSGYSISVWEEL